VRLAGGSGSRPVVPKHVVPVLTMRHGGRSSIAEDVLVVVVPGMIPFQFTLRLQVCPMKLWQLRLSVSRLLCLMLMLMLVREEVFVPRFGLWGLRFGLVLARTLGGSRGLGLHIRAVFLCFAKLRIRQRLVFGGCLLAYGNVNGKTVGVL